MDFTKYFSQMVDWKKLPAYKLEPRIDSFIGYYLLDILKEYTKEVYVDIIPEFPLSPNTVNLACLYPPL